MNDLPALKYLLCFIIGIVIGLIFKMTLYVLIILLCGCLLISLIIKKHKIISLCFIICIALSGMLRITLAGEAFSDIHKLCEGRDSLEIIINKQKTNPFYIDSYIVTGRINGQKLKATLYASKDLPVLIPGQKYLVSDIKWEPISSDRQPYAFDYFSYARVQGISHRFKIQKTAQIKSLGVVRPLIHVAYMIRQELSTRYLCVLGIEKGSLVNGLLFGLKAEIPSCIADLFRQLGVSHLLAVSGLHVGLIMLIVYQILITLGVPRIPRAICIALFLTFYCFLTGGSPSVVRSSLMTVMLMFAPIFQRKYNALNAVAASAVILLLINPYYLMDLGFQFSYSAVFGILIGYPRLKPLFGKKNTSAPVTYIKDMLAVSLSAALFTSPVAVYYFNSLQLASMLLNLIVIPLTFCVMICAILCLPGLFLHNIFADLILHALDISLDVFIFILRLAARSNVWTLQISSYWKPFFFTILIIALIVVCVKHRRRKIIGCLICTIAGLCWFIHYAQTELVHLTLKKGSVLLYRKGRSALVINTGRQYFNYNDYDRSIVPVLQHWGIKNISLLIGDWRSSSTAVMGRLLRDYPDCEIIAAVSEENPDKILNMISSDTCLYMLKDSINIFSVNKNLIAEFNFNNTIYRFDSDSLYANGKGIRMKLIRSSRNMLFQWGIILPTSERISYILLIVTKKGKR